MNAPATTVPATVEGHVERMPAQPRREQVAVESAIAVLDTAMFEHLTRIAKVMAASSLVPAHLNAVRKVGGQDVVIEEREAISNCLLVVNQAVAWRINPFAVAQHTFVHKGKLGYEGKLIAAIINKHPSLVKRLTYDYEGTGEKRKVTVSGRIAGDNVDRSVAGDVATWKTTGSNSPWSNVGQHDQMLAYRGAREWARRYLPEVVLGVWSDDEVADFSVTDRAIRTEAPPRGAAALKDKLGAKAQDADTIPAGSNTVDGGNRNDTVVAADDALQPTAKPLGNMDQRDHVVATFASCADAEVLDLARDAARAFEWTVPDLAVIEEAYNKRKAELQAA